MANLLPFRIGILCYPLGKKKVECVHSLSVSKKWYPGEDYWSKDVPDDNDVLFNWEPFEGTKRNLKQDLVEKVLIFINRSWFKNIFEKTIELIFRKIWQCHLPRMILKNAMLMRSFGQMKQNKWLLLAKAFQELGQCCWYSESLVLNDIKWFNLNLDSWKETTYLCLEIWMLRRVSQSNIFKISTDFEIK